MQCNVLPQCKLVVNIKKWVDINEYIQVSLHKIGARLLGKLTIHIIARALKLEHAFNDLNHRLFHFIYSCKNLAHAFTHVEIDKLLSIE